MDSLEKNIEALIVELAQTEHGFKHIIQVGDELMNTSALDHFDIAKSLISHDTYQARMLGTYLLGLLSAENITALNILKTKISADPNWRVQEMLAKAFDHYAGTMGYEKSLPVIREWLTDGNPNVVRAVIEGLRIWTSRPYFKTHPEIAVELIARHRNNESEYVRKSAGNALRDITRKHRNLVEEEISTWDLTLPAIAFTYKLVLKNG